MSSSQATAPNATLESAINREFVNERRKRTRDVLLAILTPILLLTLWELAAKIGWLDARLFTPPTKIAETGWTMILSGQLWMHAVPTVLRLIVGFILGTIFGIAAGLFMGVWRPVRAAFGPMFTALYALPKIAILPLLLLIFGLTETPKVLAVVISVFFVVQISTLAGIVQIDSRILEAGRAYGAIGWKRFRFVLLPAAIPEIFTGLRVAAGSAVIVVTAVEFVASNSGLGYLIWNSWQLFQPAQMYVGLITVSIVGAVMTALVILLERLLLPWQQTNKISRKKEEK